MRNFIRQAGLLYLSLLVFYVAVPQHARAGTLGGGYRHSCAVLGDGKLYCWGRNDYGQLGSTSPDSRVPVPVGGTLPALSSVGAGSTHTCALTVAGAVYCWGINYRLGLGTDSPTPVYTPTPVPGLANNVSAISVGESHSCAFIIDGSVKCWGTNSEGQVGGSGYSVYTPTVVPGLNAGVAQVAVGPFHTCAAMVNGSVRCWGRNYGGTPVTVAGFSAPVTSVAVGHGHNCALTNQGTVECWGRNDTGQLGDGTGTERATPGPVIGLGQAAVAITSKEFHTCALLSDGTVKCWGMNLYGQLGSGEQEGIGSTPVAVVGLPRPAVDIQVGGDLFGFTCVRLDNGDVYCWGSNMDGTIGSGIPTFRATPVAPVNTAGVTAVSLGYNHSCALDGERHVQCWGDNESGQLGDGTHSIRTVPTAVLGLPNELSDVAGGYHHTCAIDSTGSVYCWGSNYYGQLGDGTQEARPQPTATPVALNGPAKNLAAAFGFTCAVLTDGSGQCWGYNGNGTLGNGSQQNSSVPAHLLHAQADIEQITAGQEHACLLTNAGQVFCWGNNSSAAVGGNDTNTVYTQPNPVAGIAGVTALDAGSSHTCAVVESGALYCWGSNAWGQLGVASPTSSTQPLPVPELDGATPERRAVRVAAGSSHTCVTTAADTVLCWGYNGRGELGDGGTSNRFQPQPVPLALGPLADLAAGSSSTCAVAASGAIRCWGDNSYGQLGNGESGVYVLTPQRVSNPISVFVNGFEDEAL